MSNLKMSPAHSRHWVFWYYTPSPHQSAYIRALAEEGNTVKLTIVVMGGLEEERRTQGWRVPDFGNAQVILKPGQEIISEILQSVDANTVQVFSEFIFDSTIRAILLQSLTRPGLIGLISEGRDWRGTKGILRQLHSLTCERRFAQRVDFVLGIGHLAGEWYRRCGYSPEKIFDFAYVVEKPIDIEAKDYQGPLRLVYIGQLIPRKRVDLLLQALSHLNSQAWELRIIGEGPQAQKLTKLAKGERLNGPVRFLGVKDNAEVRHELANADVLVLPSHWDGWGAVVNEALMSGSRAICSDFCGAAELIKETPYGEVFAGDSASTLAKALQRQTTKGPVSSEERQEIKQYARSIEGESIAGYLDEIIGFVAGDNEQRPIAPWKRPQGRTR
ncbi:MAG: glycosyltransferase family 4 protein [Methylococcaceae bacterium]|nr:glycosyltransferase family 4 protein [Methylococcaceae bacterium]